MSERAAKKTKTEREREEKRKLPLTRTEWGKKRKIIFPNDKTVSRWSIRVLFRLFFVVEGIRKKERKKEASKLPSSQELYNKKTTIISPMGLTCLHCRIRLSSLTGKVVKTFPPFYLDRVGEPAFWMDEYWVGHTNEWGGFGDADKKVQYMYVYTYTTIAETIE